MPFHFYSEVAFFISLHTKTKIMEYQIIPITTIKRIESWLTDEAGFQDAVAYL